jgi:hypothetical protein
MRQNRLFVNLSILFSIICFSMFSPVYGMMQTQIQQVQHSQLKKKPQAEQSAMHVNFMGEEYCIQRGECFRMNFQKTDDNCKVLGELDENLLFLQAVSAEEFQINEKPYTLKINRFNDISMYTTSLKENKNTLTELDILGMLEVLLNSNKTIKIKEQTKPESNHYYENHHTDYYHNQKRKKLHKKECQFNNPKIKTSDANINSVPISNTIYISSSLFSYTDQASDKTEYCQSYSLIISQIIANQSSFANRTVNTAPVLLQKNNQYNQENSHNASIRVAKDCTVKFINTSQASEIYSYHMLNASLHNRWLFEYKLGISTSFPFILKIYSHSQTFVQSSKIHLSQDGFSKGVDEGLRLFIGSKESLKWALDPCDRWFNPMTNGTYCSAQFTGIAVIQQFLQWRQVLLPMFLLVLCLEISSYWSQLYQLLTLFMLKSSSSSQEHQIGQIDLHTKYSVDGISLLLQHSGITIGAIPEYATSFSDMMMFSVMSSLLLFISQL